MRKIALCLQTCDRPDYTARTLASFAQHNDLSQFRLIHGDDGSKTGENLALAKSYGFKTAVKTRTRIGCLPLRTELIAYAAGRADWILFLENDIESVRPFPWALFEFASRHHWIYCLRLFGAFKGPQATDPCKTVNQWKPEKPVVWKAFTGAPEPAEYALIHWSAQPTVTRAKQLYDLHRHGVKELRLKTARVVENVMVHFGAVRTSELGARERVAC
jgi:hypothetical protein